MNKCKNKSYNTHDHHRFILNNMISDMFNPLVLKLGIITKMFSG